MPDIKYKGMMIVVSNSAMRELMKHEMTLYDIVDILANGHNAPRRRGRNKIEKWIDKGNKTFNAVIVKSYNEIMKEDCWVLIHFGKFTKRK